MQQFFMGKSNKNVANGNAAASSEMEDGKACYDYVWDDDPSLPLISSGKVNQTGRDHVKWIIRLTTSEESVALIVPFSQTNLNYSR